MLESHLKLTQDVVEALAPPESGRKIYFDLLLPGFGVRVSAPRRTGHVSKVYVALYPVSGKLVFETIAKVALMPSLKEAREHARESMLKAQNGVNPVEEKRAQSASGTAVDKAPEKEPSRLLPAVLERYMPAYAAGEKKKGGLRRRGTVTVVKSLLKPLKNWQPYKIVDGVRVDEGGNWSTKGIGDLTYEDVKRYWKTKGEVEGAKVAANNFVRTLSPMLGWCVGEKLIAANPIAKLWPLYPQKKRKRKLSDPEIRAFWLSCAEIEHPYGSIYQLLLLKATRLREVANLPATGELDLKERLWTLPAARTKTNQEDLIPLTDLDLLILNRAPKVAGSKFWLAGPRGGAASDFAGTKEKLDALMVARLRAEGYLAQDEDLEPWEFRDLRRTARTGFSRLKIAIEVKRKLLNHRLEGMDAVYDVWEYFDEKKEALEKWAALVKTIVSKK